MIKLCSRRYTPRRSYERKVGANYDKVAQMVEINQLIDDGKVRRLVVVSYIGTHLTGQFQ